MRVENIKIAFMEQMSPGTYDVWVNEFRNLRLPISYNLRADPFEFASITSNSWWEVQMKNTFYLYPAIDIAGQFLSTFKKFPPRHEAASYTVSDAIDRLKAAGHH
jgi:arylsulfatase